MKHTWDAIGNLTQRQDLVGSETENFTYDSLDRLTGVSGAYTQSYAYNTIGNITSMNGNSYTYGTKPHAVTAVGSINYAYDANGNMTTRGSQTTGWDVENRVISVTGGASFVYDGDGNRVKKTENSQTILYINKCYEKNLSTGIVTTSYYLGTELVAQREGTTLKYIHQDSLNSTSIVTNNNGTQIESIKYFPFGATRSGSVSTDKKFTGKRLDGTGLYYYETRYYDPTIGKFTSPDTAAPDLMNPQSLNKYSYCFNNPLKYNDPTGHWPKWIQKIGQAISGAAKAVVNFVKENVDVIQTALDVAGMIPVIGEICDVASGIISVAKGDWGGAVLSLASAIPVVGNVAGGAKIVKNAVKLIDDVAGGAKNVINKAVDLSQTIAKNEDGFVRLGGKIHANSLDSPLTNYGYVLKNITSGKIVKIGETTNPIKRFTQTYLDDINAKMVIQIQGTKREIHSWQHEQIVNWAQTHGKRPRYNLSDW